MNKVCTICNNLFQPTGSGKHKYCSIECREVGYSSYKDQFRARYKDQICVSDNSVEGIDFVTCQICGERGKRLYGKHFNEKHNGLKKAEYQKMFPGAPVACDVDNKKLNETRGKWMREPAHRERQAKLIQGTANPMSKEKASEAKRKQSSPFSIEYWKKRHPELDEETLIEMRSTKVKEFLSDRVVATSIQYYLNMGFDEDSARAILKDRQTTFSLAKCIEKYGEEAGLTRWKKRQNEWNDKVFNSNTHIGRGRSNLADSFIEMLFEKSPIPTILYGANEKFIYDSKFNRVYKYDICDTVNRHIIEFNGDYWHCNPKKFKESYYHTIKKMTASQIWDYDTRKKELAESYGYRYLIVWESDYRADPEKIVETCLKFLKEL
jgi:hypothetical protein